HRHANLVRIASSLRPDMIFGKDRVPETPPLGIRAGFSFCDCHRTAAGTSPKLKAPSAPGAGLLFEGPWIKSAFEEAAGRILSLPDDASEPHLASMGEDGRAVPFDVLVEPDAGTGLSQDRRALAELKRIAPQVVAIELDQVERPHEHVRITA